jgi:hypothetical protein
MLALAAKVSNVTYLHTANQATFEPGFEECYTRSGVVVKSVSLQLPTTVLSSSTTVIYGEITLLPLNVSDHISASVMSLSKETQEETAARVYSYSNSQKINTPPSHTSPPHSSPYSEPRLSNVQIELKGQVNSSGTVSRALITPPPTPRPNSSERTHKDEKPSEDRKDMTALTLKAGLGISNDRCGCLTQKGTPCKISILEQNRDQVEIQIEVMLTFTQSSPELDKELDRLVRLVHCGFHNYGKSNKPRIKAWKETFPISDGDSKPVDSIEEQIREVISQDSAKCAGKKAQDKPCQRRIGGQRVQNFSKTVDEIVKPGAYGDDACLEFYLKVLQANMYCHDHTDQGSPEMVASWKLDIMKICEQAVLESAQSVESDASHGVESPTRPSSQETGSLSTETSDKLNLQSESLPTPRSSRSVSPNFTQDPAAFWPSAYDTTPFEIISRSDTLPADQGSYNLVQAKLGHSLNMDDQRDGHVYLYTVKGNEKYVKIGYTGRLIEERHKEWTFDCNRKTMSLYPKQSYLVKAIPHARRVEALCHAELDHHKVKIYCKACLKPHIEWFEVSPEEAIGVIEKWSKWIAKRPYQSKTLRSRVTWSLVEVEKQRARNIAEFMNDLSAATKPAVALGFICEKEGTVISVSVA